MRTAPLPGSERHGQIPASAEFVAPGRDKRRERRLGAERRGRPIHLRAGVLLRRVAGGDAVELVAVPPPLISMRSTPAAPEERREQLLDAVLRVIVSQAVHKVSMDSVAKEAGQVAARHKASLSGGHTRGHQPQPSTFRLRWRSSQSIRR